jgi:hypothetical protein
MTGGNGEFLERVHLKDIRQKKAPETGSGAGSIE